MSGSGKNLMISNADQLEDAFSGLFTDLLKQLEIEKISFINKDGNVVEGKVCAQSGGVVNCPIGDKDVRPVLSGAGESGNYNIHVPVSKISGQGSGKIRNIN